MWGRLVDVAIVDTVVLGLSRDVYFNKYGDEVWADPETCHPNSTSNFTGEAGWSTIDLSGVELSVETAALTFVMTLTRFTITQ